MEADQVCYDDQRVMAECIGDRLETLTFHRPGRWVAEYPIVREQQAYVAEPVDEDKPGPERHSG
jgi:hypothetical protein